MRLNSIKLAGFKSFVDPTELLFQSNLTAIVGPNGCGKSNIVDAIHFVLGSTSRGLRAEMMSDVIFNGTTSRKPVGQASIELIFDNQEGRIGGEYAQYPEISIRRELSRDGQSNYYLNGVRCRRRDITDIFLGTGLGNNSYAIIEQGMIARLIEAKPEELRAHVEEAAGTSKYKERRRETENRIKHTRENLDRLNDLREEQGKQLNHLQRQAQAAEKYKAFKSEQRLIRAQLQVIYWQTLNEKIAAYQTKIREQENILEAKIAQMRGFDKDIEQKRSQRVDYQDAFNEVQAQYYSLGAEISRIEQNISHAKERKKQLETDYEQLEVNFQELKQQQFEDQSQLEELTRDITRVEQVYEEAKELRDEKQDGLKNAEQNMHAWQEKWDHFNEVCAQANKKLEVENTKIAHLEQKYNTLLARIARIQSEQVTEESETTIQEVVSLKEQQKTCQQQHASIQEQLDLVQENISLQRTRHTQAQEDVNKFTKVLRDLQAQHASMQALQQIALGKNNSERSNWLAKHNLTNQQRLAEGIEVKEGWELAVETVLAKHLDSICIKEFSDLIQPLEHLNNVDVSFFNLNSPSRKVASNQLTSLAEKVSSDLPISNLLQNIFVAENLHEALNHVAKLTPHESIVTRDGIWLNTSFLHVSRSKTEKTGVLQREHDMKELHNKIKEQQDHLHKEEAVYQEAQELLNRYIEDRETIQHELQLLKASGSELAAKIQAKESYIQQLQQRQSALQSDLVENQQQVAEVTTLLQEARGYVSTTDQVSKDNEIKRQSLLSEREQLRDMLDRIRQEAHIYRQNADEAQIKIETTRNQVSYLNQNLQRIERQLSSISDRRATLAESLQEIGDPLPTYQSSLQETLAKRSVIEEQVSHARQALGTLESSLLALEKDRHQIEKDSQEVRNTLEQQRLDCQALKVKHASHEEQIVEAGFTLEELQKEIPQDADANTWEENLIRIDNRIQRLGPINLAAIDEYSTLSERKAYLDQQHQDLVDALETLENAIRKIDKETRVRFKETFNQLNDSFRTYFHQIFGGGEANLELTSDDLLETGVMVKAQPPGKRNSTIHLLSGGEKALTAIALVFAIFSLNPAPFCVLDEVDAPLDDANVGRFCNLVRKMSEKVQFVFISHNKITIEMGQQLAGVTMNEPGVSRLVSVDVEQAINMATT